MPTRAPPQYLLAPTGLPTMARCFQPLGIPRESATSKRLREAHTPAAALDPRGWKPLAILGSPVGATRPCWDCVRVLMLRILPRRGPTYQPRVTPWGSPGTPSRTTIVNHRQALQGRHNPRELWSKSRSPELSARLFRPVRAHALVVHVLNPGRCPGLSCGCPVGAATTNN